MTDRFNNAWDALEDTPEEAENMKMRSVFRIAIKQTVKSMSGTQTEKAAALGITQPRLNDRLNGKIQKFSLDALAKLAVRAGLRIGLDVKAA